MVKFQHNWGVDWSFYFFFNFTNNSWLFADHDCSRAERVDCGSNSIWLRSILPFNLWHLYGFATFPWQLPRTGTYIKKMKLWQLMAWFTSILQKTDCVRITRKFGMAMILVISSAQPQSKQKPYWLTQMSCNTSIWNNNWQQRASEALYSSKKILRQACAL